MCIYIINKKLKEKETNVKIKKERTRRKEGLGRKERGGLERKREKERKISLKQ